MIKFVYLLVGSNPKYQTELRYSIATLLAEIPEAAGNIHVYTDNPAMLAADSHHLNTMELSDSMFHLGNGSKYFFKAKPSVVLDALRTFGRPCVFLDTDTFVMRGFGRALKRKLQRGAVMDRYLGRNPFPECIGLETKLPSGKVYRYDAKKTVMYNSGVIGVRPDHAPAIEDAISIIDAIWPLSYERTHIQEQYAINEALHIHGAHIGVMHWSVKHYCSRWEKRYMHWRFQRMADVASIPVRPRRPRILVNKPIGWCFRQYSHATAYLNPIPPTG